MLICRHGYNVILLAQSKTHWEEILAQSIPQEVPPSAAQTFAQGRKDVDAEFHTALASQDNCFARVYLQTAVSSVQVGQHCTTCTPRNRHEVPRIQIDQLPVEPKQLLIYASTEANGSSTVEKREAADMAVLELDGASWNSSLDNYGEQESRLQCTPRNQDSEAETDTYFVLTQQNQGEELTKEVNQLSFTRLVAGLLGHPRLLDEDTYSFGPNVIPTSQIFYDSIHSIALCNIKPVLPGHSMVISRRKVKRVEYLTAFELADMWQSAQRIGSMLEDAYTADSLTFAIQDGEAAGQTVPHVHIHIIPRKPGDLPNNDEIYHMIDKSDQKRQGEIENNASQRTFIDPQENDKGKCKTSEEMKGEANWYSRLLANRQ